HTKCSNIKNSLEELQTPLSRRITFFRIMSPKFIQQHYLTKKSSRRERLTPVLSHHRTYGSVYGGSIKIIDASLYITSVNSCSLYASGHSTLQEVSHGIHRFLPQVRYYVFCVHLDSLNVKGYSLLIVRSFLVVLDQLIL